PDGQGKPELERQHHRPLFGFNPPPARWPGETRAWRPSPPRAGSFNPPPARWPGETEDAAGGRARRHGFNPPPARWPGETPRLGRGADTRLVSIRPRPDGQGKPGHTQRLGKLIKFQSAPGPMARGNPA